MDASYVFTENRSFNNISLAHVYCIDAQERRFSSTIRVRKVDILL